MAKLLRHNLLSLVVAIFALSLCSRTVQSESPLADALQRQDISSAGEILRHGVDVNARQADGMTALHWAVYHDNEEIVDRLLTAGAFVDVQNRYGVTPLSVACQNGNGEIVETLLEVGADPNVESPGGETALMTAARTGKLRPVQALLAHGADVNAKENKRQTAIMWAAAEGHVEVVDTLIRAGADFQTSLPSGFTPLFFAVREGRIDVTMRLLAAGIDVNDVMKSSRSSGKNSTHGTSALILAVENGHFELAAKLLEAGADPNDRRSGYTALHAITWVRKPLRGDGDPPPIGSGKLRSLDFVQTLVAHGADVNARHGKDKPSGGRLNKAEATAFLLASDTTDLPLLKLLLKLDADPTLKNVDGCTPLLAAAGVGILGSGHEPGGTEQEAIPDRPTSARARSRHQCHREPRRDRYARCGLPELAEARSVPGG